MKTQAARLIILSIAAGACLFADQFSWGNTYAQAWQGYGTSPYTAIDNTTGKTITVFCLDFNDEIAPPFNWNATIRTLNQSNVASGAQYGGNYNNLLNSAYDVTHPGNPPAPNQISDTVPFAFNIDTAGSYGVDLTASTAYDRYLEAAWLFSELSSVDVHSNLALVAQVAAWDLFVNSSHLSTLNSAIQATTAANGNVYGFTDYIDPIATATPNIATGLNFRQAVDYALAAAQAAVVTNQTFTGAGWRIVTADASWVEASGANFGNTIPAQEFLSPASAPEPSEFILFGTVVGLIGFAKWRRRTKRQSAIY